MNFSKDLSEAQDQWYDSFDPNNAKVPKKGFIRDPVLGHIGLDSIDFLVLDAPPVQRLRGIAQLSFVDRIYPGANHTRFEHCLGVATIVRRLLESLQAKTKSTRITRNDVLTARLAAYFHDIGHLPFSHLLEPLFRGSLKENYPKFGMTETSNKPHELLGHMIIKTRYFQDLIRRAGKILGLSVEQNLIASLAMGTGDVPLPKLFLKDAIHGDFDCDRMDYLVRDAYYCGVPHGEVDLERMIETFTVIPRKPGGFHLGVDVSGLPSVEMMYASRHTMYNAVYHHHTSRIVEGMIVRAVRHMVSEGRLRLQSLIRHTDASLIENAKSKGPQLSRTIMQQLESRRFLKRFLERRLFEIPALRKFKAGSPTDELVKAVGPTLSRVSEYFEVLENTLSFEQECAEEVYPSELRSGALLFDCPNLELPKGSGIDVYLPVDFGGGKVRPIVEVSPIVRTIAYEGDAFATSILLAGSKRQTYKQKATRCVKEKLRTKFGLKL